MKHTVTQQDGWPTINSHCKPKTELRQSWIFKVSSRLVFGSGPARAIMDSRPYWHLLLSARNTCLSVQLLVPQITYRCHYLVAQSVYPSFCGVHFTDPNHTQTNLVSPPQLHRYWRITERCRYKDRKVVAVCRRHFYPTKTGSIKNSLSKNFGWENQQHCLKVLEHGNCSGAFEC
jgi:hypothetical protein